MFTLFYPLTGIDKSLYPGGHLIETVRGWIPCVLPWENCTLKVWHHGQMPAVGTADTGHVVIGAIWIARIVFLVVFGYDMVTALLFWKGELAFAVSYPDA